MDAEALVLACNNDRQAYNSICFAVQKLRSTVDVMAATAAKANAEWHDDPEAEDYAAFHEDEYKQFPRDVRDAAIIEMVGYYLKEMTIRQPDPE